MQPAIPAHEYSADERAGRARGAGIAFLLILGAAFIVPATAILVFMLSR